MYNPLLDTFIIVCECKSFTKASEKLFITPAGVMRQINALEKHLNLKLFDRTASGLKLTFAGKLVHQEANKIINQSNESLKIIKNELERIETTFCVGTSLLNPAKPFMDLWYETNKKFPNYKLHLVPFEDQSEGIINEIKNLGIKFDFLLGVCDSKKWLKLCNFLKIGEYKKMIAVSRKHRLAQKEIVNIEDLYGETLMMVSKGDSALNDLIRADIETNHPQIKIEDTKPYYDIRVFNKAAETSNVLLTIECWKDVHPGLVTIPVNWDYNIPYGLLYAKDAPSDVKAFVLEVKKTINKKNPL